MNKLFYDIRYDESVNRWWITDMQMEPFLSPCEAFEGDVNLGEGYVQIIYPVRKEFLKKNSLDKVSLYNGKYDRIYFPFEQNRVDFTTFIHTPHHIWIYGKTGLFVKEKGNYKFDLYTCGGVKIWINGKEFLTFSPYTRNIPDCRSVTLPLEEGFNEICVYADELAERDVFFYFEMRYKENRPLQGYLESDCDTEQIKETELFLKSCYFEKDCVTSGDIYLNYDPATLKKDILVSVFNDKETAKLSNVEIGSDLSVTAKNNTNTVKLGNISQFRVGVFKLHLCCYVNGFPIIRNLVLAITPDEFLNIKPAAAIADRKKQALSFVAEHGETVVGRAMAILETTHSLDETAMKCISASLAMIEKKDDCADFYLSPMLILITRYRKYLPDALYVRIRNAILNFRYWIDEPGNDVMWYFSENHALLFHTGQYLAGNLFSSDTFTVSGRTGYQQYETGRKRLLEWFSTFEKYGYAEWNSATYIPIDLIGFLCLYSMAPDKDIKEAAKKALDFTFNIIDCNSFHGVFCSSFGRIYEETVKANKQTEPNFLQWVATGTGNVTSASRALTLFCLSDYVPESTANHKELQKGAFRSIELDQGINKVKTYSYQTYDYMISCARRYHPFVHGHQQQLMNAALGEACVPYFINHPGERPYSGGNRPSYWAGNGTTPFIEQYKNTLLIIYHISPDELVHYIHAYVTLYQFTEYKVQGNWLFLRVNDSYAATYFSNGFSVTSWGANTKKEVISKGLDHGIIVKCGSLQESGCFESFIQACSQAAVSFDGCESLSFDDPQYGMLQINNRIGYCNGNEIEYSNVPKMKVTEGSL